MSFDFGSLSGSASDPFRVVLLDPSTDLPLTDVDGKEAYIDVLSMQSEVARGIDRKKSQALARKVMKGKIRDYSDEDQFLENVEKLANLTTGWYLVDPSSKKPLDVPFSVEAAAELYKLPLAFQYFMQAWVGANEPANFIKPA